MRTHPAQEYEVADLRHVDAGGEQIDGDGDARQALVLVAQDGLIRFVGAAGDLHHRLVVERSPDLLQRFSQQLHDQIGVMIVGAEDQGFLLAGGVDLPGQFVADDAVESGGDDQAVEGVDLEIELVGQGGGVHRAGRGLDDLDLFALVEVDALLGEQGDETDRRFVVDQPAVDYRFAVAVGVDRTSEDVDRVLGGRCGQRDLHCVEVIEHPPVRRDVVGFRADFQLALAHFAVEDVAAVRLVDDDEVVAVDRDLAAIATITEDSPHHALDGGHMDLGGAVRRDVAKFLDIVNLGEHLVLLQAHVLEGVLRLFAERGAVDEEKDAVEAFGLQ